MFEIKDPCLSCYNLFALSNALFKSLSMLVYFIKGLAKVRMSCTRVYFIECFV